MRAGNKSSPHPSPLPKGERGKTANVEHFLFPLPYRERVRVRVKIRSEARFRQAKKLNH
jgi:hypothetical protein